jgi:peptide/nickel transport system substrate-binding protein
MLFIGDPNTALANLLSGEVHLAVDDAIRFEQGLTLQHDWAPQKGIVLLKPDLWRGTYFQLRRDALTTPSLTDVRVRRALSMLVDKQGLNQGLFEGQGLFSEVPFVPTTVDYFAQIEPAVTKYPYDPAAAQALLTQAGFSRGPDGAWMNPTGGRLSYDFTTTSGAQNESELSIMAAGWRQAGLEINESIFPVALAQDQQARSSFPSLMTISMPQGEDTLAQYRTASTPRAETRWVGFNRGSWSNPDFDRAAEAFLKALDQGERVRLIGEMEHAYTEDVASIPLFFNANPIVAVAALKGPRNVAPASAIVWDIQAWELQ